jgi:hypothetical protein
MAETNIWGQPIGGSKKKSNNVFGSSLCFGLNSKSEKPKRESVATSQRNAVLARQKNKCARCGKLLDMRAVQIDHIKEVYKGGKSTVSNLQALCSSCHSIKTHEDKLKQTEKKKAEARNKKDESPFGSVFGSPSKKKKSPFDF